MSRLARLAPLAALLLTAALAFAAELPPGAPPPLKIVGSKILNSRGEAVRLRGVNCASMEWTSDGERHILQTVNVAIRDWHVNHIRLPLAQDRWFGKAPEQTDAGKAYRALVRQVVDACASQGVYIILDLHWSDMDQWGKNIGQHLMPDQNSLAFWRDLAPVYANHPAVIYDLYNEPHNVTWDLWLRGGQVTEQPNRRRGSGSPQTYQAVGMQPLLDAVRATGAKNVVIAGGIDWAYDFSGILAGRQLKDPDGNGVLYANHAYNNKGHGVEVWIARMEKATATLPVIVSEFGGSGDWLRRAIGALEDHQWSWTAWDLHPRASPCLISDWNYTPTPNFGVFVKQALAGQLPPYTPPPAKK